MGNRWANGEASRRRRLSVPLVVGLLVAALVVVVVAWGLTRGDDDAAGWCDLIEETEADLQAGEVHSWEALAAVAPEARREDVEMVAGSLAEIGDLAGDPERLLVELTEGSTGLAAALPRLQGSVVEACGVELPAPALTD